ncbi:MAG: hypothetical protein ACI9LX_000244 [Paraglaciecola sp.]|jgi:hypothetical protein
MFNATVITQSNNILLKTLNWSKIKNIIEVFILSQRHFYIQLI